MSQDYNKTLNLPKTEFPMRAGLPKSEPVTLNKWEENNVYEKLMEHNEGKPLYVLHDGPPYANGDIHLGHALNKILKDILLIAIPSIIQGATISVGNFFIQRKMFWTTFHTCFT